MQINCQRSILCAFYSVNKNTFNPFLKNSWLFFFPLVLLEKTIIRTRCKYPSLKALAPRNTSLDSPLKGFMPRGDQRYTDAFPCFRGSAKIWKGWGMLRKGEMYKYIFLLHSWQPLGKTSLRNVQPWNVCMLQGIFSMWTLCWDFQSP